MNNAPMQVIQLKNQGHAILALRSLLISYIDIALLLNYMLK